jgi:PPOX class probable F420-dependent enzyme
MAVEFSDMTQEQIDEFLQASRHAILATNRIDGAPQISAVWYLYEDGKFYIAILADSAKFYSLRRDPRISICIDGGHPDARAVTIYGTAELMQDDSAWRDDILFRITRRYVESDKETSELNDELAFSAGEVLVVVTPIKIFARDYN